MILQKAKRRRARPHMTSQGGRVPAAGRLFKLAVISGNTEILENSRNGKRVLVIWERAEFYKGSGARVYLRGLLASSPTR